MNPQPREDAPSLAPPQWKPCSHCAASNPPWASDCMQCRQPFPDALDAAAAETMHIEYVLLQLPDWRRRGLLSDSAFARLRSDYLHLQQQLADTLFQQQKSSSHGTNHAVVSPASPVASAAVNLTPPSDVPNAPSFRPMDLSGIVPELSAPLLPQRSTLNAQRSPAAEGLRRFFQKHALQVLFALASVLVLAALRTMLGWTWIGDVAMRLLPVVPLGLTAMFWTFGQKTRVENPWAAFTYHSLAAALSAFDVIALNKYWLPTPLTAKPALLMAALAALCVSGALFRKWRESAYLHLFQVAALTTLFAVLQMLRFNAPPGDFRITPLWLFGTAFLSYAAFCLLMARQSRQTTPNVAPNALSAVPATRDAEQTDTMGRQNSHPAESIAPPAPAVSGLSPTASGMEWRMAWTFWAHFSVIGVVFLAAVNLAWEHPSPNDFALLSLLTGLIYVSGAQLLQDTRMVRVSSLFLVGSGLLWLNGHYPAHLGEGACAFLLTLSAFALTLASYNRQQAGGHGIGEQLAKAYLAVGRWNVGFAAALACLDVLYAFGTASEQGYRAHGMVGCVLSGACGGFILVFARVEKNPVLLYAAFLTWAVGLAGLLLTLSAPHGLYPLVLTLYGIGLVLIADRQSHTADRVRGERMSADHVPQPQPAAERTRAERIDWAAPQRNSGIGLATLGATCAVVLPFWDTLTASWAWTTATLTLALLLYILQARNSGKAGYAYAALLCAACISALLTWRVLVPQPFRIVDSLTIFALLSSVASLILARRDRVMNMNVSNTNVSNTDISNDVSHDVSNTEKRLWGACVTHAALVAALICLGDGVYAFCLESQAPHYAVSLLPCLVSSLLLCAARYVGNRNANDALRRSALVCAGIAACVEVGLICHVWQGAGGWEPTALRAWGMGLVALGWAWKLAAHSARKWNGQDWWLRELTLVALTTAFLGLLPLTFAAQKQPTEGAILLFETAFAATFALFALEADRTRKAALVTCGLLIVTLAALANRAFAPDGVTLTLVVYGLVYTLLAVRCRTTAFVSAASLTLSAAYVHHLLSLTEWYAHSYIHSPVHLYVHSIVLSWPRFAFYAVQAALLWLLIGWQVRSRLHRNDLARPLLACAASLALASGLVALLTVQTPGEGKWSILTLGAAGAAWFMLWVLEQGEICLHVAAWNLILAWGLILYDRLGANPAFLDLYLLPVGLHLLTIGHLQSRRHQQQQARSLWTVGLLLTITPAFLAFWNRAGDIHTLLFVGECLLSALWGLWQRIRAFVLISMGFIALYAASVIVGHLPDVWGTLVTLLIGVTLFVVGFYILTHRAVMQRWVGVIEKQWEAWQTWR